MNNKSQNAFTEGELHSSSVVKDYLTTAVDGKKSRSAIRSLA